MRVFFALFLISSVFFHTIAFAQEAVGDVSEKEGEAANSVAQMLKDIGDGLDSDQQNHLFSLYQMNNAVILVSGVREDIAKASTECGAEHSNLSKKLKDRYKTWDDSIMPLLDEVSSKIDNMVIAQDYAPEGKIRDFMNMMEQERKAAMDPNRKIVTSLEACETLLNSMDQTQIQFGSFLQEAMDLLPNLRDKRLDQSSRDET